jgi:hypothetical protein
MTNLIAQIAGPLKMNEPINEVKNDSKGERGRGRERGRERGRLEGEGGNLISLVLRGIKGNIIDIRRIRRAVRDYIRISTTPTRGMARNVGLNNEAQSLSVKTPCNPILRGNTSIITRTP